VCPEGLDFLGKPEKKEKTIGFFIGLLRLIEIQCYFQTKTGVFCQTLNTG
jgi:hypothetical protein